MSTLHDVQSHIVQLPDLLLENGQILARPQIAYETYGRLNEGGDNAVLIAHGYAAHHHAAGFYASGRTPRGIEEQECGWWDGLIGPGKAIDTGRCFVISSNTLGSSYGSTGPGSINPHTGKPYGPDFPVIRLTDMVNAQYALLQHLGVTRLQAVVGFSYGGYLAFQWAVQFPELMDGVVAACSSPKGGADPDVVQALITRLAQDANWHYGWYYDQGGMAATLTEYRLESLQSYGTPEWLAKLFPDASLRERQLRERARFWAASFDANSLVVLRHAAEFRDAEKDFARIKAKLLYVLCRSDALFPPTLAAPLLTCLKANGVDACYAELDSADGHVAALSDSARWAGALRQFMDRIAARDRAQ